MANHHLERWPLLLVLAILVWALMKEAARRERQQLLYPVVLVPGYASNELDARLTHLYRPSSPECKGRKKGWFRLYLNYTALHDDPAGVRCFGEQMSAVYDAASDDYYNVPGVETRVPLLGSTEGFRHPDPDRRSFSYMDKLVGRLEAAMGYRDGDTMFGAPYDFRYAIAPAGHPSRVGDSFFRDLKRLVESASRRNGGRPAIIVTHSYGGTLAHQFLIRMPLPWRRRFVRRFVPVAAPWGGLVLGMQALVSGNSLGLPFVDPRALKREYRSLQSSLWPLPNPKAFGAAQPLVSTKSRNYTASDVVEFLGDIGFGEGVAPYESRVAPLFGELPVWPRVAVTCVVGVGVETAERMVYPADDFDAVPGVVVGEGDGLVNLESLIAVEPEWRRRGGGEFRMVKIANASHTGILVDDPALNIVITEIQRAN